MNSVKMLLTIDRLRRECDIRDPERRLGYLTALMDMTSAILKSNGAQTTKGVNHE